jgi:hypothetical protein
MTYLLGAKTEEIFGVQGLQGGLHPRRQASGDKLQVTGFR